MPEPPEESTDPLAHRVTALEELLTHFERTVSDLDGVVRQTHDRLDTLQRRIEMVERRQQQSSEEES